MIQIWVQLCTTMGCWRGGPVAASTAYPELTQRHHVMRDVAPTNWLVLLYIKRGVCKHIITLVIKHTLDVMKLIHIFL